MNDFSVIYLPLKQVCFNLLKEVLTNPRHIHAASLGKQLHRELDYKGI